MKITHIHIERFRGFQNEDFEVGSLLTAIAGQNGTQKSTLLGIITQTFTLKTEDSMRVENMGHRTKCILRVGRKRYKTY